MKANRWLLQHKYVRVIQWYAAQTGVPLREALETFYRSETHRQMAHGISDMHCRSDGYLAEELQLEVERTRRQAAQMKGEVAFETR
jgi:hypothetical protein